MGIAASIATLALMKITKIVSNIEVKYIKTEG